VTFTYTPTTLTFDPDGGTFILKANVSIPKDPSTPSSPGSFCTPGTMPRFGTTPGFLASLNDDFLNRGFHAAWQGGLLSVTVDQKLLSTYGITLPFNLNAGLLALFFPSLNSVISTTGGANSPMIMKIFPNMQPLCRVVGKPELLELSAGELMLEIYVDLGNGPQKVMAVAIHLQVEASVVSVNDRLLFRVAPTPAVASDVVEMPLVPLNNYAVETFINFIVPPVLPILANSYKGFPLPSGPVSLTNLKFYQDGSGDFLTISGDLK
jgi:hypothetical protein